MNTMTSFCIAPFLYSKMSAALNYTTMTNKIVCKVNAMSTFSTVIHETIITQV